MFNPLHFIAMSANSILVLSAGTYSGPIKGQILMFNHLHFISITAKSTLVLSDSTYSGPI